MNPRYRDMVQEAMAFYLAWDRPDWKPGQEKLRKALRDAQKPSQPLRHLRVMAGRAFIQEYEIRRDYRELELALKQPTKRSP